MVVIVGRVVVDRIPYGSIHLALHLGEELLISFESSLFIIVQTVVAHILQSTATLCSSKGIGHGRLSRYLSPLSECEIVGTIHRHTTLIELLAIAQDIFRHLAKVDIEVATIFVGIRLLVAVDEWVHEPELQVFDVGLLKVVGIELTHHTTPMSSRVQQLTVVVYIGAEVIRTTLVRVVGNIENRQCCRSSTIATLVAVRIKFANINLTHIMV